MLLLSRPCLFGLGHRVPGLPGGSNGKESACNAADPGSGRSPGEENGNPFQSEQLTYIHKEFNEFEGICSPFHLVGKRKCLPPERLKTRKRIFLVDFFKYSICLFIFGCAGCLLLCMSFSLVVASGGFSLVGMRGFSLQ